MPKTKEVEPDLEQKIYCVKCKKKTSNRKAKVVETKNNRNAISARCKVCDTKKFLFVK
jgi:hypothetical protein